MKNRSFKVLCHKQIQNAKSKRCPDRAFGQDGGGTWSMAGCPNDVARLAHFQSMIQTTYSDRICYRPGVMFTSAVCFSLRESGQGSVPHVLLGNPDGVDPDSLARSVSSRRVVPTPCTRGRSPLRSIAHSTRGRILSGRLSTFYGYFTSGIPSADVSPSLDISHSDGRGGRFNFSGQTYPNPLIALTKRVLLSVYSATVFS